MDAHPCTIGDLMSVELGWRNGGVVLDGKSVDSTSSPSPFCNHAVQQRRDDYNLISNNTKSPERKVNRTDDDDDNVRNRSQQTTLAHHTSHPNN
jgi:hypothetical protein